MEEFLPEIVFVSLAESTVWSGDFEIRSQDLPHLRVLCEKLLKLVVSWKLTLSGKIAWCISMDATEENVANQFLKLVKQLYSNQSVIKGE